METNEMSEDECVDLYIYERDVHGIEYKSGCCMAQHDPESSIRMVLCTEKEHNKQCDIWYCAQWIQNTLKLNESEYSNLCASRELFKCHGHGFSNMNLDTIRQNEPYQPPTVDDEAFECDTLELRVDTHHTNRQTEEKEQIELLFRRRCQNGVLLLEMADKGCWKAVSKGIMHKYKKKVFQQVLDKLLGYQQIKQNKDVLEKILYALCGIEEDPLMLIQKVLGSHGIAKVVQILQTHKIGLAYDVFQQIKNADETKSFAISSISGYLEDVYYYLYSLKDPCADDNACTRLLNFLEYIWDHLLNNWKIHPADKDYINDGIKFVSAYHQSTEYELLQEQYQTLLQNPLFEHKHLQFESFAYGMYLQVDGLLKMLIEKTVLEFVLEHTSKHVSAREYDNEQRLYLTQSMIFSTINSQLRKVYGGNYSDQQRDMLIDIIRSMILPDEEYEATKIAFRIRIENNGGYRILTHVWTKWADKVIKLIEPEMPNIVLRYKGKFMGILETLLANVELKLEYQHAIDQGMEVPNHDECDTKLDGNEEFDKVRYKVCRDKLFKMIVSGLFNRCIWGYLKSRRPERGSLTLRSSLKLSLSSSKPKYSSLQTN
eukprot:194045_1